LPGLIACSRALEAPAKLAGPDLFAVLLDPAVGGVPASSGSSAGEQPLALAAVWREALELVGALVEHVEGGRRWAWGLRFCPSSAVERIVQAGRCGLTRRDTASRPRQPPRQAALMGGRCRDRCRSYPTPSPQRQVAAQQGLALQPWGEDPDRQAWFSGVNLSAVNRGARTIFQELERHLPHISNPVFASAQTTASHTSPSISRSWTRFAWGATAPWPLWWRAASRGMRAASSMGVVNHSRRGFWAFISLLENGPRSPLQWIASTWGPLGPLKPLRRWRWWWRLALPAKDGSCGYQLLVERSGPCPDSTRQPRRVRAYLLGVARGGLDCPPGGWLAAGCAD